MTKVDVCNIALGRIGRKAAITSLTENSTEARACNRIWDMVRQSLLREFTWSFSHRVELLAQSTDTVPGWQYLYAYPSDCLQALRVFNEVTAELRGEQAKWDVLTVGNNTFIACNVELAYLEYTADRTDPDSWTTQFSDCLAWRLAFELAMPLTGDQNLRNSCWQLYMNIGSMARTTNAAEKNVEAFKERRYLDARK
ncbi:MAG: hypothetical protein VB133_07510 [Anaeromusa sp.]|uniref:hypothetical protein n=1 Tax=Anaeromusa sp. TaxID=1872520 RepID=UPI002B215019|nr:hypothetical protein [Anaeromusa sp.]MEA4834963.1 hypothetical protein [Anaeromusa sp.]